MGYVIADRVKDSTSTTGTGTLTIANSAPAGFRTFASVMATNDFCYYTISSSGVAEWEVGIGTLTSSTTLTRDKVLASSNSNALVSFSAGTKDVFMTIPAVAVQNIGQDLAVVAGIPLN